MESVDDSDSIRKEGLRPQIERTRHVHADRLDVVLVRAYLPFESFQRHNSLASGDFKHSFAILIPHGRDEPSVRSLVPEHVKFVYADVDDLAVVPFPVTLAQAILDGVAHRTPGNVVLFCKRLHRGDRCAVEQLLREGSRDPGVLVCRKRDALVCRGMTSPTDDLAYRHDEPNLTLPVWQSDKGTDPVGIRGHITGFALRALCVSSLQIKAEDAKTRFLPKFAF